MLKQLGYKWFYRVENISITFLMFGTEESVHVWVADLLQDREGLCNVLGTGFGASRPKLSQELCNN